MIHVNDEKSRWRREKRNENENEMNHYDMMNHHWDDELEVDEERVPFVMGNLMKRNHEKWMLIRWITEKEWSWKMMSKWSDENWKSWWKCIYRRCDWKWWKFMNDDDEKVKFWWKLNRNAWNVIEMMNNVELIQVKWEDWLRSTKCALMKCSRRLSMDLCIPSEGSVLETDCPVERKCASTEVGMRDRRTSWFVNNSSVLERMNSNEEMTNLFNNIVIDGWNTTYYVAYVCLPRQRNFKQKRMAITDMVVLQRMRAI
jgi:hypothetical protein